MLLAHVTNYDTLELLLHLDEEVSKDKEKIYFKMIEARCNNYPIQYIIGNVSFLNCNIKVNENVLIPRFETEELVFRSIKYIKNFFKDKSNLKIVDLGTGSGCIAIALKKAFPDASIDAIDISKDALDLAKKNAKENGADVNFYLGNMLDFLIKRYDVIISNPPYIGSSDEVEEIVLNNEPHNALFAPKDGLYYYEEILSKANNYLNNKSMIIFEIGYQQGQLIKDINKKFFPQSMFVLEKDMANKDRFVFIYNN